MKNYCTECTSYTANSTICSRCGGKLVEDPTKLPMIIGGVVILLVIGYFIYGAIFNSKPSYTPSTTSSYSNQVQADEWYIGGTLHKAKVSEWKIATEKNKLATCCDFILSIDSSIPMSEWKTRATALKNCIDTATRDINTADNEAVSMIASTCMVLGGR
ncbi:MAG: hypothetical protein PHU42_03590 [Patescibacteria group bacterium]|nr:hypothetical protein [Patescibacteria group bacterium]